MDPDQCARIHERLDDGSERFVVVSGNGSTGEVEVDSEFALVLGDVRSRSCVNSGLCRRGWGIVHWVIIGCDLAVVPNCLSSAPSEYFCQ